jgi:hypothetical protein
MRLSPRLGIPLLLAALLVGAYTLYWRTVADRLAPGVVEWAQRERGQGIDASWRKISVTGYPFSFRIRVAGARLSDPALTPSPQLEIASLSATAWPWNLREWRISAPKGLAAAPLGKRAARLSAASASGTLSLAAKGSRSVSLKLEKASAAGFAVEEAALKIALPAKWPQKDTEKTFSFAVRLKEMKLPFAIAPLGARVAQLSLRSTFKGAVAPGPFLRMAEAWREEGGTIDLDHFRLGWGALGVEGSGTLALDERLQPEGAFSATIEGYDEIVAALVASGRMHREAGGLARIALRLLSKKGPQGQREIATSLSIEHREITLGPAKLGRLPRLSWGMREMR